MLTKLKRSARSAYHAFKLPPTAKTEVRRDKAGLPEEDPGNAKVISAGINWIKTAQDHSHPNDGGIARSYSLINGWSASYPETTGYIIPVLLTHATETKDTDLRHRAKKMLDWLLSIQLPAGGFHGGLINAHPKVPVTFNTGSVLIGLAAGAAAVGAPCHKAMTKAAQWLQASQDADGCWRKYPSPFAAPGEKVQDTHVAWGLLEAARVAPGQGYAEAALKNIHWALSHQTANGWFEKMAPNGHPASSHTMGFVLRGLIEAYEYANTKTILTAACSMANGLLRTQQTAAGFLPGLIHPDWTAASNWACLVANAQITYCWLRLYRHTSNETYRRTALEINRGIRRTIKTNTTPEISGALKGSFPINGNYMPYTYLSPKFIIEAIKLEEV